jgi:hypothetical protein
MFIARSTPNQYPYHHPTNSSKTLDYAYAKKAKSSGDSISHTTFVDQHLAHFFQEQANHAQSLIMQCCKLVNIHRANFQPQSGMSTKSFTTS